MKKIHIAGFALFAILVFSAFAASSAFAETEWLLNGAPITGEDSVLTEGEIILDLLEFGALVVAVDCSGSFVGTVGPGSQDLVNEVWNLGETVKIGQELVGTALSCEVLTSALNVCGPVGGLAEVWVDGLPWETKLLLVAGVLVDDFPANSGYHILCPSTGLENLCLGVAATEKLTNEVGGVSGEFIEANNEEACTKGFGHVSSVTPGLTQLLAGDTGTLTVS